MGQAKEQFMQQRQADAADREETTQQQPGILLSFKKLMDADAATIDTMARAIVQEVANGNQDALETLIYAKKGAALFKAIDDNVKNYAYGKQYAAKGEQVVKFNCKIEQSELGVSYDYETAQDPEWVHLKSKADAANKALKDREAFLKTIKDKMDVIIEGEPLTIYEPVKKATLGYKITLK